MRIAHVALALALGAFSVAPVMAQTALPGQPTIPQVKPVKPAAPPALTALPAAPSLGKTVNINTATAAQLDTIPQIGDKRAAAIIKGRPYKSIDELVSKKAISNGIFQKIKSFITV